jgi:hypothetical protein
LPEDIIGDLQTTVEKFPLVQQHLLFLQQKLRLVALEITKKKNFFWVYFTSTRISGLGFSLGG